MILGNHIFVHIPKTGGSSIEKSIQESWHNGEGLKYMYNKYSIKNHPHSSISEYAEKVNIADYESFTILRDPFTQIRSLYNQLVRQDNIIENLNNFVSNHLDRYNHYIDQYWYTHIDDELKVNKVFTFDEYSKVQDYVEKEFKIKINRERKVWATKYTKEEFTDESTDIIRDKYHKSIALYNSYSKK